MKSLLCCLTVLLAAACLAAGCRGGSVPVSSSGPAPVAFGSTADLQSDPFALNSASVTGTVLTISVSYSGGCRNHEFVLTAAESFQESWSENGGHRALPHAPFSWSSISRSARGDSPVQLPMVLTHDGNDDPCEAYLTEQRRFDLTSIKERYQAAYGQESGTVLLLLQPLPLADDQPLVYQF